MKKRLTIFFAFALMSISASAQTGESLPFTRIGRDAVRQAMAGAGSVSGTSAAWASFDNAALAAIGENVFDAAAGYQMWTASKSTIFNGGLTYCPGKVGFTAGASYGIGKEYDILSPEGVKKGTFKPTQMLVNLGAGAKVLPWLAIGANVHYASEKLGKEAGYGAVYGDVFVTGELGAVKFASGVVALGTKVKSVSGTEYPLPTSVKVAAGYEKEFGVLNCGAYADLDGFVYSKTVGASLGANVGYKEMVNLRCGFHYGSKGCVLPSYASCGLGFKLYGISIDAAMLFGGMVNGTMLVSAGYSF